MLKLFLRFEYEKILKYFKNKATAKLITSFLFVLVFVFVGIGIYKFFVSGFKYINMEAVVDIRLALTLFIYEIYLLVLAGIIIFSSTVTGIFNLFKGEYNNWVLSTPSYKVFPRLVLIRSSFTSALPSFVMFIPAVLAFTKVNELGTLSLIFILTSVVLFLILLNALTLLLIVVISYLYYKLSQIIKSVRFSFSGLIVLLIALVTVSATEMWRNISDIDLVQLFRAEETGEALSITNIISHFNFLPSHPFAMEILEWQNGQSKEALISFSILLVLTVIFVSLWWKMSSLFYPMWQKFQEGSSKTNPTTTTRSTLQYRFRGGGTMALFKKELLVSTRNWKGILWFLFLSFLWLLQIGTNVILNHNVQKYQTDISQKIITLQALQFIIAIYFISSFALRFVFPSFSVEKKTAWVLASAPLSFKKIFFGKYFFYTSFFLILGIVMNYINSIVLHLPFTYAFYSMLLFVSAIIFIITLALSLGALYPNTETDDPEVISTSMSGLFFTALSLLYGALGDWTLYITLNKGSVAWLLLFVVVTFVVVTGLLIKVPASIKNKIF